MTRAASLLLVVVAAVACSAGAASADDGFSLAWQTDAAGALDTPLADQPVFEGPVPRATCDAGSLPEGALQGEVPLADRQSGRSTQGYRCNMALVGQYQGQGTTWVSQSYEHCAYFSQAFPSSLRSTHPGVNVIDVRDTAHPRFVEALRSPAFRGNTWESLKVNEARGLLAGVQAGSLAGAAFFDVYDIKSDCLHPKLLNSVSGSDLSLPVNALGHEGNWSPDGKTYWATGVAGGSITAIDVADPSRPRILYSGTTGIINHGLGVSADGNRLYIAEVGNLTQAGTGDGLGDTAVLPNGVKIFDVSQIQSRARVPQISEIGHVYWTDGAIGQHAIPITYGGQPYIVFVDEAGAGAARIIDIADEHNPRVVSKLKLEIHLPQYASQRSADTASTGSFGYEGHYCTVDRQTDPTALACGYFQSGIRVFDIRDPLAPREVAYYNPPAQTGKNAMLTGSEHASGLFGGPGLASELTADWCSSPPRFVADDQLWVTCQDNGFMVLRYTEGRWPLGTDTASGVELPTSRTCFSRRRLTIHLHRGTARLRSVVVYVNGRRVRTIRHTATIDLRGFRRGTFVVKVVAKTSAGRRVVELRRYRTCAPKGA